MSVWIGTLLIILALVGLLFWLRGRLRRTHTTVRELQKQVRSLTKSVERSGERAQRDLKSLRTEVKVTNYDYDSDCLRVWGKSVAFLEDEKFMSAYRKGIFSGQRLAGGERDVDLHIEWRIHVSCWAAHHAAQLEGDFVECGDNTGIFSIAVCDYIDFENTGKKFYLFDTYEGIPTDQINADEKALNREAIYEDLYEDCYALAQKNFAPYPNAVLVKGRVPESLETVSIDKVCYMSLDMNIAEPEVAALEFFWEKLVPGAIVTLDDYGWADHRPQKDALDAFASSVGVQILTLPTGQGLIIRP